MSKDNYCSSNENEFESPSNETPLVPSRAPLNLIPDPSQYQSTTPQNDAKEKTQSSTNSISSLLRIPGSRVCERGKSSYLEPNSAQITPVKSVRRLSNVSANGSSVMRLPAGGKFGLFPRVSRGISVAIPEQVSGDVPHFELDEDPSFWKDHNVQVLIRIRPLNEVEKASQGQRRCLRQESGQTVVWLEHPETRFTFDHIACESTSQEKLFRVAGLPMVDNCMSGYNSCMFSYGQTGSGKTYTMMGEIDKMDGKLSDDCGITPRIFDYLFTRIAKEEESRRHERLTYSCKCSFLEIYNEQITDLLEPSSTSLHLREDLKKGVYVENLTEHSVITVNDVLKLLRQGAANRKIAATYMNSESSRSHSVFTCTIESRWEDSMARLRFGRLNLVDLAGSERQKSSGAEGDRLKEAANINKSLSTLGLVIMSLVDLAQGKHRHVPYRDSRLTFLLQDSLGGNSKTTIIANVSPSSRSANETLSTLKFAQRAKLIQNNAKINEDASGDVVVLQQQIQHLKSQLSILMKHQHASTELPNQSSVGHFPGTYESPEEINLCDELKTLKGEFAKTEYFEATLEGALRRDKLAEMEAKRLKSEIEHLNSLAHQREEESQRTRIMLRLHEEKIKRFELLSDELISADKFYQDENNALREENLLLQAKIDMNPEVTRLALENDRLIEQIRSYQDFYEQGERQTFVAEISELRNQVLELLEVEKGRALPQFSPMKGKHVNYELEFAKELEECKNMNSTVIREVDGLRLQIADGMNCDNHTSNSVRTSYMQLSDGPNMDGLQAKLDELACELKEAETLNRRYTEDCAREDDKKAELIRNEVELETTKTIIHLQEEIDRLQSDFKLKLCSLGEQNISLRNDLAVKEEESRMFCAEWERAIMELTTFLTDGSRSLGVASCQIKSISSSFPNVNDWIGEHVEKAAKICLEKEKAILLLQKSLEDAKKDVTQMQQKLFSLMGATIALTELQQMEKSASGEESQFSKASNNSNEVKDFAENKLEVLQHIRNEIVELNKKLSYIHACFYNVRTIHCHLGSRDGVTGANGWTSDCSSSCSDSSVESEVNDEISSSDIYGCICKITEGKSDLNCDEGSSMTCNRAVLHLMKEFRKAYGAFVKLRDHLLELCVDGTNQSCVADIVSFCDQRALDDLKDHPTNQRIASSKNLGELFVEEKPYPPITFDKFEETYAAIKEADDTLKAMLKANETANMSAAMWKKAGEDLMTDKASLSEEIKQLKSQDQVHFSLNEISNLLSLLEGCFLQMQTGVEEVLETTHRDAVEERSSLEDLMCKSIENDFTIFVLQRQMVEYFEKLSRAKSISTSDGFTLHDDCLITGDSELRQDESVDKNSELVNQLKRKNNLLKGLLFDFSLLQEFASHRKDIKDELEKLISALSKVQHELQIKTIQLDDLLVHNTKLEGNLAEAEQALFNSNHELNQAKDESNILSEQNVELKDLLKELYLKNSEAEQLLEEQKEVIKSLEKEIFRVSSSAKRFNLSVEDIDDTLIRVTAERDELVKTLNSLQDRFDMACALADENLAISVEARQESEASKMYAEQKEEEVKILEHSVEELECTINVLQKKLQEMEDEVEKHRLMSDSLELELHELRHRLLTVEDFTESLISENSNAAISEDQLFRKFHGTCEETNEALDQIRILQEENAKQSKEIKLFKDYISELVLHAEAQASQYQHKYKSLETMLNEVKTDLLPNVSAASTLEGTEKISTRARGSRPSSPFKCISGLVQQMNLEKDQELAIARLRIEELEALAASRHREVCILNTRLASTESMTHDVIRDLLSVKLDISNYANIIDQHRLQSLIEDAQHQRQNFFAMEQEIVNLRGQIDDLLEERERCISEIQKSKEQQLARQITVEQVKERDQLLVAQNDMLKMDKSNLQKRIVELDDLVKKLLKMQPRNQLQTNSSSRLFDSSNGERSVDSQNMLSRINNQIAQNRQIGADMLNTRANGTKLRKHKP